MHNLVADTAETFAAVALRAAPQTVQLRRDFPIM